MDNTSKELFGTDGIRSTYGEFPLDETSLVLLGAAVSRWANQKYGDNPSVLIGCDTRESSEIVCMLLFMGMLMYDIEIYDAYIVPTPAIVNLVKTDDRFDFGIMVTASHNPYQDNGIKIIDKKTGKISKKDEEIITKNFYSKPDKNNISEKEPVIRELFEEIEVKYLAGIAKYFEKDFLKNTKVVLDCAHGTTFEMAPSLFKAFGAQVITLSNIPDGTNINENCGSTHPQKLQKAVLQHNADIGFAFDGDGDRVIAVSKNGEIKDGDDILCLLTDHPAYKDQTHIVGTIMSNYGLESHLKDKNITLIRTPVGDKFVSKEMRKKDMLLGGEQSGHIILGDYLHSGDGIFAALRAIETIKLTGNTNFETFKKCPQVMINIPVKAKKDLNTSPFADIIAEHQNMLQNGRLIVRYSGTENVLRVAVEEQDNSLAKNICVNISNKLEKELNR